MKLRAHYICEDCAGDDQDVILTALIVTHQCCFCGVDTCGRIIVVASAPCDDTCVPAWSQVV